MRDFDFVKFTIGFALFLALVAGGAFLWLGSQVRDQERALKTAQRMLAEIGEVSADIDLLEQEKAQDDLRADLRKPTISYLQEQAQYARIDANRDYSVVSRKDDPRDAGYIDEEFILDFKVGGDKRRENLFKFVYNVESQSPRIKLVKARLQLEPKFAKKDEWRANLTFRRRDPHTARER